jgi:hypothetical protein
MCEFPQISHTQTVLYEIIIVRLGYYKFCARWVLKMLMGAHKTQRMALASVEFMQKGTTVMLEVYCKTLKELCRAI